MYALLVAVYSLFVVSIEIFWHNRAPDWMLVVWGVLLFINTTLETETNYILAYLVFTILAFDFVILRWLGKLR